MSLKDFKTIKDRREFLENDRKVSLKVIGAYNVQIEKAKLRNCENMIGAAQVPLGVAGPLLIKGDYVKGKFYIPLATTEGALVASVSRGCKAVTLSDGARVVTEYVGISRGAVFCTKGVDDGRKVINWLQIRTKDMKAITEATSSHLTFLKSETNHFGKNLFVRFFFDTQDAMGMNMATIASDAACRYIEKETGIRCVAVAGNFDIDKKAAWINFLQGRGRKVWADIVLKKEVVTEVLKTTPERIHEVNTRKNLYGAIASGSLGYNAHFANVIAAIFTATGQDIAHTVEGSLGVTTTEIDKGQLYISVYLPDLVVGTVGGGTALSTQKEALSLLGCAGGDEGTNTDKFAEIIAGAVLSGEISLLASLAAGTLASSHQKLAR